jgi:amino acid transporter
MPVLAILLSVLGLIPLVLCGLAALGPNAETAARMLHALIGYAALILAFAGGVHWGFELQSPHSDRWAGRLRLAAPVAALLAAWLALELPLFVAPLGSLIVLIVAYVGALLVEHRAARSGLLPHRYLWLRWGFTVPAVAMLMTVFTLRILGQTIAF